MEAMETNLRVTSFFSSSYAVINNPIISFLAVDVASSEKIIKSKVLTIVNMGFSSKSDLRETIIESQELGSK